jgi:hypothetical protein
MSFLGVVHLLKRLISKVRTTLFFLTEDAACLCMADASAHSTGGYWLLD